MNKSDLDWRLLPSFLALVDHTTLVKAASSLGLSQPTLGRHLVELEEQLGIALFERTGRNLVVTPQARQIAEFVREMDNQAESIYRLTKSKNQNLKGRVRISASQPVACMLLPIILKRMAVSLPEVEVDLISSNSVSNLLKREADIALRMVRPNQDSLIAKKITQIQIVACAHSSYLAEYGNPLAMEDLLNHKLIGLDTSAEIETHAKSLGFDPKTFKYSFRSDDYIAQWFAIKAGIGIGFSADYVVAQDSQVKQVLTSLKLPALPVWLTVHREINNNLLIRAVYDFLTKEVPIEIASLVNQV